VELAKVRLLGLSAAEEHLILAGNFLRLVAGVRSQPAAAPHALWSPRRHADLVPSSLEPRRSPDPWLAGAPGIE
jgi:hypothetical protein